MVMYNLFMGIYKSIYICNKTVKGGKNGTKKSIINNIMTHHRLQKAFFVLFVFLLFDI
jgi:hypothetical protein